RVPPLPLTGHCPPALEAVIARLLGPTPDVRYDSARAVREGLERFKSGKATRGEELGWASPDVRTAGPSGPAHPEAPRRARRAPVDPDATRRTRPALDARPPSQIASAVSAIPAPLATKQSALPQRRLRLDQKVARGLLVLMILVVSGMTLNECAVAADA